MDWVNVVGVGAGVVAGKWASDPDGYWGRTLVERVFAEVERFRRVTPRYEKFEVTYPACSTSP